jgi:hypothetical protein
MRSAARFMSVIRKKEIERRVDLQLLAFEFQNNFGNQVGNPGIQPEKSKNAPRDKEYG